MALVSYPEFLQTRTYSAAQMRHLMKQLGVQEGVLGATDFDPSQRGAGANMSVDIAAGDALVQGDDVTRQGLYHVVNDAVVNAPIAAAHATLPRIDQVILHVYDSTVVGVSDVPLIEVVTGTPTAGATLDNRNGAAALPNNAIRLADVLVGAAVVTILNASIRDRRPWARGAHYSVSMAAGNLVLSTSFQGWGPATSPRLEIVSGVVRISTSFHWAYSAGTEWVQNKILIDGAAVIQELTSIGGAGNETYGQNNFDGEVAVAAGSHTFDFQSNNAVGNATLYRSGTEPAMIEIQEIILPNAQNS